VSGSHPAWSAQFEVGVHTQASPHWHWGPQPQVGLPQALFAGEALVSIWVWSFIGLSFERVEEA